MSQESKFCHRCGAALPVGAGFCPKCGTAVAAGPSAGQGVPAAPSPQVRHEKQEKQEKHEKQEKGEKHEKGRGGDLAGAITGGLILILLGILLYYATVGNTAINFANFWQYLIIGIGAILIVQGLVRYVERGVVIIGTFVGGIVLMFVGFVFVSTNNLAYWPLILVLLGVAAIASAFSARRRAPTP